MRYWLLCFRSPKVWVGGDARWWKRFGCNLSWNCAWILMFLKLGLSVSKYWFIYTFQITAILINIVWLANRTIFRNWSIVKLRVQFNIYFEHFINAFFIIIHVYILGAIFTNHATSILKDHTNRILTDIAKAFVFLHITKLFNEERLRHNSRHSSLWLFLSQNKFKYRSVNFSSIKYLNRLLFFLLILIRGRRAIYSWF